MHFHPLALLFVLLFPSTIAATAQILAPTPTPTLTTRATRVDLRARATTSAAALQTALCGWLGGDPGQPWTCAVDGTCVIATAKETNAVGCCVGGKCGTFRTACIPATVSCGSACQSNAANLRCANDAPLCATFTYPGNYTELRCTNTLPNRFQVAFTYDGFQTPLPLPRVLSTMTSCDSTNRCVPDLTVKTQTPKPSSTDSSKTSSRASSVTGSKTSSASSTGATTSATSSSTGVPADSTSTSHTGAIVGGVVGGIAATGAAAAGIFFYYMRKRRNENKLARSSSFNFSTAAKPPTSYGGRTTPALHDAGSEMDGNSYFSGPVAARGNRRGVESHEMDGAGAGVGVVFGGAGKTSRWEREPREGEGVVRQDTPLMELDADESGRRR